MKLMLNIATEIMSENPKPVSFKEIFKQVKETLKVVWKEKFPRKMMADIEKIKIGELYTQLTLDGRFIMTEENKWTLTENLKPKELARAKARLATSDDITIDE